MGQNETAEILMDDFFGNSIFASLKDNKFNLKTPNFSINNLPSMMIKQDSKIVLVDCPSSS